MDSTLNTAALMLARGDAFGALNRVALRDDAPALALRGIAMARLGDFDRAKATLKRAAQAFGPNEAMARARCVVAEAELALVSRDLGWPVQSLEQARATLESYGDVLNTAHARNVEARRLLLIGQLDAAEAALGDDDGAHLEPALAATRQLVLAGVALRRLRVDVARQALHRAEHVADLSGIAALRAEVDDMRTAMDRPAARVIQRGVERQVRLDEVQALMQSGGLIVDACRRAVWAEGSPLRLATRPVLFALLRALAEAWPADAAREALILTAFGARRPDETHRARLRVEMGRLRVVLEALAEVRATKRGFVLEPRQQREVIVLAPPLDGEHAALLALMADGEAWSSSALALALGAGPRSVQRALEGLARDDKVKSFGRGRAQRWIAPTAPGFPSALLLPGAFTAG